MNKHSVRITSRAVVELLLVALLAVQLYAQDPARPSPPASAGGPASTPPSGAPSTPDKVVLKVGSEQVTQAEFDSLISGNPQMKEAVSAQGRRHFGDQYVTLLVLSQLALSNHLDSTPEVRRQLALQRLQSLANAQYANLAREAEPKPEEINQYYTARPTEFEQAQVRKVFVRKRPEGAKEGTPLGLTAEEAKSRAAEIRKALAATPEGETVAEQYKGSKDVFIDAEPRMVGHAQLPGDLDKAAFQLKEGELSDFQETPQGITFIQVIKRGHKELKDVTPQIRRQLQRKKLDETIAELKTKAGIWMDDEYFKPLPSTAAQPGSTPTAGPAAQTPKPVSRPN